MSDKPRTREQLLVELHELYRQLARLEGESDAAPPEFGPDQHWEDRERILALAVEQASEGVCVVDLEGGIIHLNRAFAQMHGYEPAELIGKNLAIFHNHDQLPSVEAANDSIRATGDFAGEIWHTRRDGTVFPTLMHNTLIRDGVGRPVGMLGTMRDITVRKAAEDLTLLQRDLSAALGSTSDLEDALHMVMDAVVRIEGVDSGGIYLPDHEAGRLRLKVHREVSEAFVEAVQEIAFDSVRGRMIRAGVPSYLPYQPPPESPEGRVLEPLKSLAVLPVKHGERITLVLVLASHTRAELPSYSRAALESLASIIGDAIARIQFENELRQSEEKYRSLFYCSAEAVTILSLTGEILEMNEPALAIAQAPRDQLIGRPFTELGLFPVDQLPEHLDTIARLVRGERVEPIRLKVKTLAGEEMWVEAFPSLLTRDGAPFGLQVICRDVTEARRMEQEMIRAEKLESLGLLAGGIAHDFNNILTGILGNISLARLHPERVEVLQRRLNEAEKACLRARDISQQLLTFSRGGSPILTATSLKEILTESSEFALRGSDRVCRLEIADDLWPVTVDPGQIGQMIQNLVINAAQASAPGGVITVRAENSKHPVNAGAAGPRKHEYFNRIVIIDRGSGIAEEQLEKIFDPYFTTKEHGSGLGLTVAYSIVKRHEGSIEVRSKLGEGTTFEILLPASPDSPTLESPPKTEVVGGKGRVLVMEDQEAIVELLDFALRDLGYDPQFALEGGEALQLYERAMASGRRFDVVIMDMTIPGGMGGREAIRRLLELDPEARAVVSSGYSTDPVMANYRDYGFQGVLVKPYGPEELSRVLVQAMDSRP